MDLEIDTNVDIHQVTSVDVDSGLEVAPPELPVPVIDEGTSESALAYGVPDHHPTLESDGGITVISTDDVAIGTANLSAGMVSQMPGLPPVLDPQDYLGNSKLFVGNENFNLPELTIPAKWLSRYEELRRYYATYGHTNVPQKFEVNKQLGAWVRTQKQQYKLLQEGKPSHMSQARIELLNDLDFEWTGEKRDKFWSQRYDELVRFYQMHGSTRVPDKYDEAPQLHTWVSLQRRQMKLFKEGKKSNLTQHRVQLLENLGLEWHIRNSCSWMERFLELKEYKEQYGNTNVPQKYKGNPSLGRWVDNQKTQHKKLYDGKDTHLTIERIQLLVSIGFQFR